MAIEVRGKVLVVDDEVGTGYALKSLLELEWFEVIVTIDGDEAYCLGRTEAPDVLIVDINMPKLGGLDLIRLMKKDRRLSDVPVIVISAAEKRALDEALELGAVAALEKPIEIDELVAVIENVVSKQPQRCAARCEPVIEQSGEEDAIETIRYPLY